MMCNTFPRRRLLLRAIAGMVLVATSRLTFGRASDPDGGDKAGTDKARPGKPDGDSKAAKGMAEKSKSDVDDKAAKGTAGKPKTAVLTVIVTGNGKPVRQALVRVTFPQSIRESQLPTNEAGEATFKSSGLGDAEVSVIVNGWQSALEKVVLKEGPVRLPIKLKSLTETAQPVSAKPPADTKR